MSFQAVIDENCFSGGNESGTAALMLANIAVSTVLGAVKASLNAASETKTVIKEAHTGGFFLLNTNDTSGKLVKTPNINNCLRFWYGRVSNEKSTVSYQIDLAAPPKERKDLMRSWEDLQLADVPYVYGELLIRIDDQNPGVFFLEPKRLFIRPVPAESSGFWSKVSKYKIALDLVDITDNNIFASYKDLSFDENIKGSTYSYDQALIGKTVGPFKMNIDNNNGGFRVNMTLSLITDGSKFAAAFNQATEDKGQILNTIVPKNRDQKSVEKQQYLEQQTILALNYFKALEDASRTENDFNNAQTDPDKKIALIRLQGARTLANLAAEKYGIANPFN